jgi:hypothetical protein
MYVRVHISKYVHVIKIFKEIYLISVYILCEHTHTSIPYLDRKENKFYAYVYIYIYIYMQINKYLYI